ncbi:uncharacterized protein F4807DRAFT_420599 [Annulohypoxylon truncatum]|uniref:uncharacterized protein n=1 Tax=Annulohypoxylon truncatum TaxID=327061 RepID=UPI0020079C27|nr:uncharacterized protein F4807DRAFT_420599 [Annulohypoxylon truncatum]KAI1210844.1 hypothetical protein F4807DRAFT_420599 [Annulohypoxylon truncatum]
MSPGKSTTATNADRPSQKRTSSFSGFFSKILPTNRPEQGGTSRTTDWTADEEIDPNELTGWNLAKEKIPAHHTTSLIVPEESIHRRVWSWSPQKGDSRFVENLPRDRSLGREQSLDTPDREPLPPRKSEALTRAEVHELFKSKEMSRKNRRSLKESGDWLGVQGADPYSGKFPVLTPTETPSSETTSSSTRGRLAGLSRKKKAAKLEYEQAKLLEEQEKDKARLDKEKAKLDKIEHAKEELRRQNSSTKWSQHKRQWSSAAEPSLSPIAQSLDSVALGSSETSSLLFSGMPTDSASSDPEEVTIIPNFSRPTRPPVSSKATFGQTERLSYDGPQRRGHERRDLSTDTIIHTLPDTNFDSASLTKSATQPSEESLSVGQPDIGRTKSERHFLWRRRRETDPGKSVSSPPVSFMTSMRNKSRALSSVQHIPKDHFADLDIPDYRLHLLSPEPADTGDSQSTHSEDSQLTTPNLSTLGIASGNRLALSSTTNLARSLGNDKSSPSVNGATVTSSQSRLKGIMRRPSNSIRRKLGTTHTKEMERNQRSPPTFDQVQDCSVNHLPEDIPECQSQHLQLSLHGRISSEQAEMTSPLLDKMFRSSRRESVSIPITTTTGCVDLALENQSNFPRPKWDIEINQINGHTDTMDFPTIPMSSHQQEYRITPQPIPGEHRTPSPPIMIQNGSPNFEPLQGTPEIVTISTHEAALEEKPPTRVSTPTTPRLCRLVQQNLETRDAEIPKSTSMVEETEPARTQVLKPVVDSNSITKEGKQSRKISQERQRKSPAQVLKVASREAQRRLSTEGQKENILGEAAQIAMLRSRTKETARNKSADRKAGRNRSRSPSPAKKHVPSKTTEPKHSLQQRHPKKKRHNEEGGGTGLPSKHEHVKRNTNQIQTQHKRGSTESIDWTDVTATAVQFCKTVYVVCLGLACTWWAMVRPAFDQQSDLWKRRHRKQSTWEDAIVFILAGVFCLSGGIASWYASKTLWWFIE